ncbi:MAG: carboxypeptidase regulatory-like domain-containing protein [Pyrinomonadaceae bacterium]|nr:carboxypeptidase regulatory-like domain-containing protein [Pyrinomonadaceae bacterium]
MKPGTWNIIVAILALTAATFAQTGGQFDLSHNTTNAGGRAVGGQFELDGTSGQGFAGTNVSGGQFFTRDGFWAFEPFAPTAALVSVAGRIRTPKGRGVPRVVITLIEATSNAAYQTTSNPFGYYRFINVPAGETYIVAVWHKQLQFVNDTQVVNLDTARNDIDFVVIQ